MGHRRWLGQACERRVEIRDADGSYRGHRRVAKRIFGTAGASWALQVSKPLVVLHDR